MSKIEHSLINKESALKLHKIDFEIYEMALKRYGYTGNLQDNVLQEVCNLIKIKNFEKLTDQTGIVHYYYQSPIGFEQGNYTTKKVLLLGFIFCKHPSHEA